MANDEHLRIIKLGAEFWNRWRESNPSIEPDFSAAELINARLSGADLRKADLSGADLDMSDLSGADFSDAILIGGILGGANLNSANFNSADLTGANLYGADLTGANLIGANLTEAIFKVTDLTGANLTGSTIGWTVFANTDLSIVKGLETVTHQGPSTIGIDTLYRSRGNIPDVFLRGAGLPEEFITYIPSLIGRAIEFYSCFISYSHADQAFARRLHDTLQGRGIRCWLDEHQILIGDNIYTEVDQGIRLWDKVLLCASKDSLTSWWVDREVETAIEKEQRLWKERGKEVLALIPLNIDGFMFSQEWSSAHASTMRKRLAADFTSWENDNEKFDAQFERLVKALRADSGRREPPPVPKL